MKKLTILILLSTLTSSCYTIKELDDSSDTTNNLLTPTGWTGTKQIGSGPGISVDCYGIASDSSGNIYAAGLAEGPVDGTPIVGIRDGILVKYNSSGEKQWTRTQGAATKNSWTGGVAVDSSDNIYVTGNTTASLDGNVITGTEDMFVMKYDSSGTKLWTKQLGSPGQVSAGIGATTDSSNNVFVVGYTSGGLDGNVQAGGFDLFITKYNSAGVKQWTSQVGTGQFFMGNAIKADSAGNVYATGNNDFQNGTVEAWLVKYDAAGAQQWNKQLSQGAVTTKFSGVVVDSSDNVYATGFTAGSLDGNTLTGINDVLLVKYNAAGTKQWTKQLGTAGVTAGGYAAAIDSSDNIFITGGTDGALDGNTATGSYDIIAVKYDSSGTKLWSKQFGAVGTGYSQGSGITTDSSGNAYIGGFSEGGVDGNTVIGREDLFITKFSSSGVKQ